MKIHTLAEADANIGTYKEAIENVFDDWVMAVGIGSCKIENYNELLLEIAKRNPELHLWKLAELLYLELKPKPVYRYFWRDGSTKDLSGDTPVDAFRRAGYNGSSLNAIDFYLEVKKDMSEYVWDKTSKSWVKVSERSHM